MPFFGSLVNSQFDFDDPDFTGTSEGPIDPRKRLTKQGVQKRRKGRKARRKFGEFKPLDPGQELEIRGFNEFQEARRRGKQAADSLEGEANQVGLSKALSKSVGDAGRSTDLEAGSLRRRQGGLGLRLSERQKQSQRRRIGLGRAVNEASAAGSTRRAFSSNASAARRGAVGLEGELFDVENAGLVQLANAASGQKKSRDDSVAGREGDRAGFLGGIAGIFGSLFGGGGS